MFELPLQMKRPACAGLVGLVLVWTNTQLKTICVDPEPVPPVDPISAQ
jgi:ribulose 1,5-bisphosphate synthetase/thiazole synthase